jgi:hypothetical protein
MEIEPLMPMVPVAWLVLQRGDGLDEVALQLLGVAPGELQRLARHDDLAGVAQRLRHRRVLFAGRFPFRPGPGEAVVGLAAEQDRVGPAQGGRHGGAHLVVEVREMPRLRRLDDAVERDEHPCDDLPHLILLPRWLLTFRSQSRETDTTAGSRRSPTTRVIAECPPRRRPDLCSVGVLGGVLQRD